MLMPDWDMGMHSAAFEMLRRRATSRKASNWRLLKCMSFSDGYMNKFSLND
jgi:hypothetical protein